MSTIYADLVENSSPNLPLILKNMPSGYVVSSKVIREDRSINIAGYDQAYHNAPSYLFGGEFTKIRKDTDIIVTLTAFAIGFNEGNGNTGVSLNKTHWDHGCSYQYDGQWDNVNQTTLIHGTHYFTAAQCLPGVNRVDFGQGRYADNTQASYFCYVLNGVAGIPSGSSGSGAESRLEGYVSTMHVYEVIP
jgi:hypothetical protein